LANISKFIGRKEMTQKQPKALRLAEMLCYMADDGDMGRKPDPKCNKRQAAAELRRLHEVNAELLEALKDMGVRLGLTNAARIAIAKAEEGAA
jgi:hypothetical protein